jgi:DNA-binding Lrp family transcriptional regulator
MKSMKKDKKSKSEKSGNGEKSSGVNVGAGLVAVGTAIVAGYYFYVSDNAKKHRKMVTGWAVDLKSEVLDKARSLKENLDKESLLRLIDEVAETYYTVKNVSKDEVGKAVTELKENWSKVIEELKKSKKSVKSVASRSK